MIEATEGQLRQQITQVMRNMDARGLNRGTSGNVSARCGDAMLVTPTGVSPDMLQPEHIVRIDSEGGFDPAGLRPSSEWGMHQRLLERRQDVNAVVHCHSRHATILACAGREIPSMHYMVALSGGMSIPVAPYATFGSNELADVVIQALDGRYATLMANHGQVAIAPGLKQALLIAEEVEEQAAVYWGTLAIGGPKLLSEGEMARILELFKSYGQQSE